MNPCVFVLTALAGGVGAGLRFVLDAAVSGRRGARFPLGIFVVNVTGSLALGVVTGLGGAVMGEAVLWMVGTGLLGGYTTFSTVSVDTVLLARDGEVRRAWLNATGTVVVALAAAAAGVVLGAWAADLFPPLG
ncbi:CrcB family protein [Microbacterium sp. LRZ72]|uniref:fluoride efflux transporter FluC n=1 Tax=Microbacterium sp. LRZ72 TaxID=2942481 RepID=UPI0029B01370|nr:CrcB family protein [Microbacterium sp. LRZ72]MDX2377491.1 CrcB family protein [Microbacterium sp. LRZ72]